MRLQEPKEQFVKVEKDQSGHYIAIYFDDYGYKHFCINAESLRIRIFNCQKYNIDVSQDKQALFLIEECEAYEENEMRKQNA